MRMFCRNFSPRTNTKTTLFWRISCSRFFVTTKSTYSERAVFFLPCKFSTSFLRRENHFIAHFLFIFSPHYPVREIRFSPNLTALYDRWVSILLILRWKQFRKCSPRTPCYIQHQLKSADTADLHAAFLKEAGRGACAHTPTRLLDVGSKKAFFSCLRLPSRLDAAGELLMGQPKSDR